MLPPELEKQINETLYIWDADNLPEPDAAFTDKTLQRINHYRVEVRRNNYLSVAAVLALVLLNAVVIANTVSAKRNNLAQQQEGNMIDALRTDYFSFDSYNQY